MGERQVTVEGRVTGAYKDLGLYLDERYDWQVVQDNERQTVLLAYKKGTAPKK